MTTRNRQQTAGHYALPFCTRHRRVGRQRGMLLVLLAVLLLPGCGAKPKAPTAPIRTHVEEATNLLPPIPATAPWQRFTFNDWERLRARAGLGDTPVAEWMADAHLKASNTLQGWLLAPSSVATAALASLGVDGTTVRWQAVLDGPRDQPIARMVTAPARDDRASQAAALATLGYTPVAAATPAAGTDGPAVYERQPGAGAPDMPPAFLDANAAALVATSTTFLAVHDAALVPAATAALQPDGANLDAVPFFHGLIAGISEVEAMVIFRIGADGYRDATAPPLDSAYLPFDAIGAALHVTEAGAQYATLAFHLAALPGGRLPEGMAEWWATRFGLDQPDPRADYLEAFGNDGWLFARYRILSSDERLGGVPRGEVPFWKSVTTWQSVQQHWRNFSPRNADPIPRVGA